MPPFAAKRKKIVRIDGALRTTLTETDQGPMHVSLRESIYMTRKKHDCGQRLTPQTSIPGGNSEIPLGVFSTFSKEKRTLEELEGPEN